MRPLIFSLLLIVWSGTILAQQKVSIRAINKLKHQLAQAQHDSTRLRLTVAIGQYYLTESQFDSVYRYTNRGLQLIKTTPSHYYAGDLYHFLARYYRHSGAYQKGIPFIKEAISQAQQARSVSKMVQFQYTLAMLHSDAGDLSRAVDQIGVNLTYLRTHQNDDMLAANYLLMVELYGALNNPVMQQQYRDRYLALVTPSWPPDHRMLALELKAEQLEKIGRIKAAGKLYQQALSLARLTDNSAYIIGMLIKQGINRRNQGQNQAALRLFEQAFALARTLQAVNDMAESKREIATTYLALQRPQEALVQARYALTLSRRNKTVDGLLTSLKCLALTLKANGLFEEALTVLEEEETRKERHFSEGNMQKIAQMQAAFDAETKENTIRTLQKNAQITQLKTIRQQQHLTLVERTQYATLIILALVSLLVGVIYYFLRKSQRNYALLTRQQVLLQQTAQELAEANSVKDKLFSLIGHDLRSPVASMKLNIRQIREASNQPGLLPPLMNRLENQVENVLTLLINLLDWSMIQLKGFRVSLHPVRLSEVMDETNSQASELIYQKQLTIINQVDTNHTALADRHQLRAVMRNLLGNAIKFTPPGGFIRIQSRTSGSSVELIIRDSGLGMSAEQMASLFTAPQLRPGTMGESGTGLGLRICRELMDQQQGTLHIISQPNQGTTVCVRLALFTNHSQPLLIPPEKVRPPITKKPC